MLLAGARSSGQGLLARAPVAGRDMQNAYGTCKMPVMSLNASLPDKGGRRAKRAVGTSPQV